MILVTGSSGFIGSVVVRALKARGQVVLPFDHPNNVLDRDEVFKAASVVLSHRHRVEGIIHLAGALGTSEIFGNERNAVDVNIGGAINVYDAAAEYHIPVVQIGTGHKGQPNPYAITKGCAEDLGLARARYCGEDVTVVRAFHVYGPGQKAIPPWGKSTVRKMVPTFICQALAGQPLEVYGSGQQLIDLVYVDDVAEVLVAALDAPAGSVIEAGTGKPTSVRDAAYRIRDVAAMSELAASKFVVLPEIVHMPMRAGEPEDATVIASSPACDHPWPWKLAETIEYYR